MASKSFSFPFFPAIVCINLLCVTECMYDVCKAIKRLCLKKLHHTLHPLNLSHIHSSYLSTHVVYRLDIRHHPELRHAVHDHGRNHHHQWPHALHHPVYHTSPQPTTGQHQYEERHVANCRRTLDTSATTAVKTRFEHFNRAMFRRRQSSRSSFY